MHRHGARGESRSSLAGGGGGDANAAAFGTVGGNAPSATVRRRRVRIGAVVGLVLLVLYVFLSDATPPEEEEQDTVDDAPPSDEPRRHVAAVIASLRGGRRVAGRGAAATAEEAFWDMFEAPRPDEVAEDTATFPYNVKIPANDQVPAGRTIGSPKYATAGDSTWERDALRRAFERYDADPTAPGNVPLFGVPCVASIDCGYARDQMRSFDTGVGYVVVIVSRDVERTYITYMRMLERAFPGRFIALVPKNELGMSIAESWNAVMTLGFDILKGVPPPLKPPRGRRSHADADGSAMVQRSGSGGLPWVLVQNGDLFFLNGTMAPAARHVAKHISQPRYPGSKFQHFSCFAITRWAHEHAGLFDEVVWPAYAEDDEYVLRLMALRTRFEEFPLLRDTLHMQGGSMSQKEGGFKLWTKGWDRVDYIFRKWGVDIQALPRKPPKFHADYSAVDPANVNPTPFNLAGLDIGSWAVDPAHRYCIQTGRGLRHRSPRPRCRCFAVLCTTCFWNAEALVPLLKAAPGGVAELYAANHSGLRSRRRQQLPATKCLPWYERVLGYPVWEEAEAPAVP